MVTMGKRAQKNKSDGSDQQAISEMSLGDFLNVGAYRTNAPNRAGSERAHDIRDYQNYDNRSYQTVT
jgi:hypothetical protein